MKTVPYLSVFASVALTLTSAAAIAATAVTTGPEHKAPVVPSSAAAKVTVAAASTAATPASAAAPASVPTGHVLAAIVSEPAASGPVSITPKLAPIPSDDAAFFSTEASLQREVTLLTLKSQIGDLKKKIAGDDAPADTLPAAPVTILPPPGGSTSQSGSSAVISSLTIPEGGGSSLRLVSVIGIAGDYQADVVDRGVQMSVHPGSALSDGWVVDSISPTAIALRKGRLHKTVRIGD
jgi:uncharacterized protein GlcG (DUF336 family)